MEKIEAIKLLTDKFTKLERLPKKSDFSSSEVCLIKAKLGPWNRALEEAGLKEVSPHYTAKKERVHQKRIQKKENKKSDKSI